MPSNFGVFLVSGMLQKLSGALNSRDTDGQDSRSPVGFGILQMFDGYEPKWATDAEDHILHRMKAEGQSGFLWNRLGNLYRAGARPELAAAAFEQSLRLDPAQLESHISLGDMLHEVNEFEDAAYHFRQALVCARTYDKVDRARVLDMLAMTVQHLFWIHRDHPDIPFMPTRDEYGDTVMSISDQGVLEWREFSLDANDPQSFYPVAQMLLGMEQAAAGNHNGRSVTSRKVGRNQPCPCGSGLKYKKCCGR